MDEKQKAHEYIKNALNNKKRIAEKLNGIDFPCDIPLDIISDLALHNLVTVFCVSDDLVSLKGTISEDRYMNNGDFIFFNSNGVMENKCVEGDSCPYFEEKTDKAISKIELSNWGFNTDIPHEEFKVYEAGEVYCVGIVFDMKDLSTTEILTDAEKDADIKFLLERSMRAGSCSFGGGNRDTGVSSNGLVYFAYTGVKPGKYDNPADKSDLKACILAVEKLPEHRKSKKVFDILDRYVNEINEKCSDKE